ncbi:unnamed protein product [Microthlaspi erraticum]|uniref:Uncharacterized protein n=1 Tax=Microthlaspi erraticum TaxID=1685480 RepID=A0A6D2HSV5_9BRAS|nr:unnamed protein product [Microthlaspi erraticum]
MGEVKKREKKCRSGAGGDGDGGGGGCGCAHITIDADFPFCDSSDSHRSCLLTSCYICFCRITDSENPKSILLVVNLEHLLDGCGGKKGFPR